MTGSPDGEKESFHSSHYESNYDTDEEDIESVGDIYASGDFHANSVSSGSISVSLAATSVSKNRQEQPEQQHQQLEHHLERQQHEEGYPDDDDDDDDEDFLEVEFDEVNSSSSSTFASKELGSSSGSSSSYSESMSASLPQRQHSGGASKVGILLNTKDNESAKLRRILYGSSPSSSVGDEYIDLSSPSSDSSSTSDKQSEKNKLDPISSTSTSTDYFEELEFGRTKNEFDYILRNRDVNKSGVEVEAENGSDRAYVDETGKNFQKMRNSTRIDPPPSVPFENDESDKESFSSRTTSHGPNDDSKVGDGNIYVSNGGSDSQSKSSQYSRDYAQRINDASIHDDEAAMVVSTPSTKRSQSRRDYEQTVNNASNDENQGTMVISESSTNLVINSHGQSSMKSKRSITSRSSPSATTSSRESTSKSSRIISSPSEKIVESRSSSRNRKSAYAETSFHTNMAVADGGNSEVSMSVADYSSGVEQYPKLNSTTHHGSGKVGNEVERKQSTIWAAIEEFNEKSYETDDMKIDEIGWKPPALTTFSQSNYYELTDHNRNKKDPSAQNFSLRSKRESRHTAIKTVETKKVSKIRPTPPISEVVIRPPPDDDSTLGTEGTYLERFPKHRKNKTKEVSPVSRFAPLSSLTELTHMVIETAIPRERYSGTSTRNDTRSQNTSDENEANGSGTIAGEMPYGRKLMLPHRPDYTRIDTNYYDSYSYASSHPGVEMRDYISVGDDPPGDAFLCPYDSRNFQKQQSLSVSSNSSRGKKDSSVEKNMLSLDASSDIRETISPSDKLKKQLNLPQKVMASWVPPNMEGRGEGLNCEATKTFIDSLMAQRRSASSSRSNLYELRPQQPTPRTRVPLYSQTERSQQISQKDSLFDRDLSRNRIGRYSRKADDSEQIPKNSRTESEVGKMSSTGSSMSQNSYLIDVFANSDASMSQFRVLSETKQPADPSQSHSFAMSVPSIDSKSTNRSYDQSVNAAYSISSSSSSSPSLLEEHFSDEVDNPVPSGRSRKTKMILCCLGLAVLIIVTGIAIGVLWYTGILFQEPEYTVILLPTKFPTNLPASRPNPPPTLLPTPKPSIPELPPTTSPTIAPTEIGIDIMKIIIEAYPEGQSALEDPKSPQTKAMKWLESSTTREASTEGKNYLQRYVLAVVYYSMNGDDWIDNLGWLTEEDECNWLSTAQNVCDESGEYVKLELQDNNLVGTLPPELAILSETLRTINVRNNKISGEIPSPTISDLTNLEVLDLSSNMISGVLAKELFDATSLTRLSLFENYLSSSIPTEIGQLTKLGVLDLGSNKLTSTIPSTIAKLSDLAGLSLFNNTLTGTVPVELSDIRNLQMLYIDSNKLEAPLPSEVCVLKIKEFWGDCEEIQCLCCTTCCSNNFGCYVV